MVKNIRRIANHHINQASFACQIMLMLIIMAITGKAVAQQTVVALSQAIPVDHIVAVVNEEVITRTELNDVIQNTVRQLQKQGIQLPPFDVLGKTVVRTTYPDESPVAACQRTGHIR